MNSFQELVSVNGDASNYGKFDVSPTYDDVTTRGTAAEYEYDY